MALHWKWDEKCGEAVVAMRTETGEKDYTISLYEGNAFLIMLCEWEDHGEKLWSMWNFFADKEHAKNCLGLNKKGGYTDNVLNQPGRQVLKSIRLNKSKHRRAKDLITMLTRAFDELTIELYTDSEEVRA